MKNLKKRIKDSGFKQNYIADTVNVSKAHFCMMINGKCTMPEQVRNDVINFLKKAGK